MKTPEEIKKGIECCISTDACFKCPYSGEEMCSTNKNKNALAYIQQLEAQNAELVKKMEQRKEFTISFPIDTQEMIKKTIDSFDIDGKPFIEWVELLKDYKRHEWISVEDGLPEGKRWVLIAASNKGKKYCCQVWFDGEDWLIDDTDEIGPIYAVNVTHWMPLPEPPKEEQ